jgi:hypothetical protein
MISGQTLRVCPDGKWVATPRIKSEGMLFRIKRYGETAGQRPERSNSRTQKINTRVTTATTRRVVQFMPRLTHQSSAQLMKTGTMISSCNSQPLLPLSARRLSRPPRC